jgi:hypothetical protein
MNWEYYVPHVLQGSEFYSADDAATHLHVVVGQEGTTYEIDQDGDGVYELQHSNLPAGSFMTYSRDNKGGGTLGTGASVRSDKPLQTFLNFWQNHYQTYDACHLFASVMPTSAWGTHFVVPLQTSYLYIFAKSTTAVTIAAPMQLPVTHVVQARTDIRLLGVPSGTVITAENPVYVLAVNCQTDQNYPWMFNVLPVTLIGTDYYHDAAFSDYDSWPSAPKLRITAVEDMTNVYIDEDGDDVAEHAYSLDAGASADYPNPVRGAHIWSDNKIYVVYIENWTQDKNGKYGGAATEYIPTGRYGTDYALYHWASGSLADVNPEIFIVSSEDNTSVNIDWNWDGVPDTDCSGMLNKGDVCTTIWDRSVSATAHVWSDKPIQVVYRSDLTHPHHPGVGIAYTAVPLVSQPMPVEIDIKPVSCPNPLNVDSKGILTVAILGSEDFEANTVDIASVRLEGVGAVRSSSEDVATPVADGNECDCNVTGPDGLTDLVLKFETGEVVEAIGDVNEGDELALTLEGVLSDSGTMIEGTDCVVIRGRHRSLRGADLNKDGVVDQRDFALFAERWLQRALPDE